MLGICFFDSSTWHENIWIYFVSAPAVIRQQARIERLRIELKTEKAKLIVLKQEIAELENNNKTNKADEELEKQLQKEIQHLRCQCERLTVECDRNDNRLPNNTDCKFFFLIFTFWLPLINVLFSLYSKRRFLS